jgi:hypothetical protein
MDQDFAMTHDIILNKLSGPALVSVIDGVRTREEME